MDLLTAAHGSPSPETVDAVVAHLRLEQRIGSNAALADVTDVLEQAYADLGELFGVDGAGVVMVDSGTHGLRTLLASWPFPAGATAAVTPSEFGPNLDVFTFAGLTPVGLQVDEHGVLDLDAFARRLRTNPPDLVHLTHLASHRGLVQPVHEAVTMCRAAGVPLWVDAAQSFGHLDTAFGADAVCAPARKWMHGPRGAGVVALHETAWSRLRPFRPRHATGDGPIDALRFGETSTAVRIGFARAVRAHLEHGPEQVRARLAAAGDALREVVRGMPGWDLVDHPAASGALVGLRPNHGQDVEAEHARLASEYGITTTACLPWRAAEVDEPLLRLAPSAPLTPAQTDCLRSALG
ncbi:hypothetical protein VV01_10725 [Luteipulveratus halotolerans]|uniref:Aminotransferase class V domain-containing protein n=1 Tax=Luteipulveratus halotolerans TaxID=1631356 RepID=A0A0L6CNP7_9MICO|nr:hypothetical protein VV01_10725 [Luteipulveratus halotolerans]